LKKFSIFKQLKTGRNQNVSEVSDGFEFFSEIFAQSPVPTMNCCVPDRA
jgi:hypothetical protein